MDPLATITYRTATLRDAVGAAALIAEGFETYREFAPPGWRPPTAAQEEIELHQRLSRGDVHARLALEETRIAAFASWLPAFTRGPTTGERLPGRAHLGALFVASRFWGTGLATTLLDWATTGMADSGFALGQLFTPRDHTRARAFYEREGWRAPGPGTIFSPELGLELVLYERPLA